MSAEPAPPEAPAAPARRLIITADDFGAAVEVNEAVEAAAREGVLSAASLMAGAPAFADAVSRARRLPGLAVGLHLVLVDGWPVSPADRVRDLIGADGRFRSDLAALGFDIFAKPHVRAQAAAEIRAQFEVFASTGLPLDHVNAHKHFHLHPTVAALVFEIGRGFGLGALRVPVEPSAALRAADPDGAPPWSAGSFQVLARRLRARARGRGLMVPDQVFGLAWSGAMTEDRLAGLLGGLPAGTTEIYLHPATRGGFAGSAPGYGYAAELAALLSPRSRRALQASGARLGGFGAFAT